MKVGDRVLYIGADERVFPALVFNLNPFHEGMVSVAYVDDKEPPTAAVKQAFDIVHESHESKDENNPDLPRIALNCWKEDHCVVNLEEAKAFVESMLKPEQETKSDPGEIRVLGQKVLLDVNTPQGYVQLHPQTFGDIEEIATRSLNNVVSRVDSDAQTSEITPEDAAELKALSGSGGIAGSFQEQPAVDVPIPDGATDGPAGSAVVSSVDTEKSEITLEAKSDAPSEGQQ